MPRERSRAPSRNARIALLAAVVLWTVVPACRKGLPEAMRGESGRRSPVLRPAGLDDRSFFLSEGRYYVRLDPGEPALRWDLAEGGSGRLEVAFRAVPKTAVSPAFGFAVAVSEGTAPARVLHEERWDDGARGPVGGPVALDVSLAPGSRLEFRLTAPGSVPSPEVLDAGIGVPRLVTEAQGPPPSNLLIISIDALRRDALGIYQELSGRKPAMSMSPELDRFSEDAVVFLNAQTTQSSTWPALSSLHLSAYPRSHGVSENRTFLEAPGASIATFLRDRGFATFALGSNGMALNIPGFEEKRQHFRADERLLAAARRRLGAQAGRPFFHWYHLFGCHDNYFPPEWVMRIVARDVPGYIHRKVSTNDMMRGKAPSGPEDVAAVRRLYAGALYYVDSLIKGTFDDLKARGLWDRTLVIVTADHGEELFDHHGYFHHSPSLYAGAIQVPLLVKFPVQRGRIVVPENVSLIDLLPTLHHYYAGRPGDGLYEGLSLLDLLAGRRRAFRERVLFAEAEGARVVAARLGDHKLIHNPSGIVPKTPLGHPFPMGPIEFYDLSSDPGETRNLAAKDDPVLRRLLAETGRYARGSRASKPGQGKRGRIELTDEERREADEALRTLGYIK